jgi:hypothetical protein
LHSRASAGRSFVPSRVSNSLLAANPASSASTRSRGTPHVQFDPSLGPLVVVDYLVEPRHMLATMDVLNF